MPTERKRAPRQTLEAKVKEFVPVLNDVIADCADLQAAYQIQEISEPGQQYEQQIQKARAIQRLATEVMTRLRNIVQGMAREDVLSEPRAPIPSDAVTK